VPGLSEVRYKGYFYDNTRYFATDAEATLLRTSSTRTASNVLPSWQASTSLPLEGVSIWWGGYFIPDESGVWDFQLVSDDASFVWLGGSAVVDYLNGLSNALISLPGEHSPKTAQASIRLEKDKVYPLRIQYGNVGGTQATFQFSVKAPSFKNEWDANFQGLIWSSNYTNSEECLNYGISYTLAQQLGFGIFDIQGCKNNPAKTVVGTATPNFGYLGYSWLPSGLAEFEFSPPDVNQPIVQYLLGAKYSTSSCNESEWRVNSCKYSEIETFKNIAPNSFVSKGDVTLSSSTGSKRTYKNVQKFFVSTKEMQDFLKNKSLDKSRSLSFYIRAVFSSSVTEWSEGVWADPNKIWESVNNLESAETSKGSSSSSGNSPGNSKPATPTFSGVNFVGNKINIDVNLGSTLASRPDKVYLIAPKLGINLSNPLAGMISGTRATWSVEFDKLLLGQTIPIEIVGERAGIKSESLIGNYEIPAFLNAAKTTSVPAPPTSFTSKIIGSAALMTVESSTRDGAIATNGYFFAKSLGISKKDAIEGDLVGTRFVFEFTVKASMAGKRYPLTIFLTNEKGESKPLNATLSIPAAPKVPRLPTAIPTPKAPKTVICTRSNQTRAFEGTTCPPGWEKR